MNEYGLSPEKKTVKIDLPKVDYLPPKPKDYNPAIALIGTGGISEYHLKNYQDCGFKVVALANRTLEKAETLRDKFFPQASIHQDYRDILKMDEVEVVDVTPHPTDRYPFSMTVSTQVNMCLARSHSCSILKMEKSSSIWPVSKR